jgi:ABC-type multidrug transport system fused ATPase/permease subunit
MSEVVDRYEDAKASMTRILALGRVPVTITDAPDTVDLPDVEFDDATFADEGSDEPVLDGVSFEASEEAVVRAAKLAETHGFHHELLAADGPYANLWRVQAGDLERLPDAFIEKASERVARQSPHRPGED